ncbi:MAG: mycothiol synthase [Frankiaceae bacterium]|nr:mycothiol synthase [Frankiaceae bacterium]
MPPTCDVLGRLPPPDVQAVHRLVQAVEAADGVPALSEHVLLHLPYGGDAEVRNLLVRHGEEVLAYAHLDVTDQVEGSSAELAVAPTARGHGLGRALVEELLLQSPDGRLRLWAHGDAPAAAKMAAGLGFSRSRVLFQMRRSLSEPLPEPVLPDGVELRTFEPGQDEQAWTELNNRAFVDHPDQGGWGLHEVELREQEPWFDPKGFFLAEQVEGGQRRLVGFHWTKVHGGHGGDVAHEHDAEHPAHEHHDHPPIGEVYIVGVDPAEQGRGLGPALTLVGLHSLRHRGLAEVLLYVDESNTAAVKTYERLGFRRHSVDVMYSRG